MIALAASASRWLLGGGWKWLGIGALALAVLWFRHDAHRWHNAFDRQRAEYSAAQADATLKHIAQILATEARYRAIATEVDTDHAKTLVDAGSAAQRYISGHRLRPGDQCAPGRAVAAAEGPNPASAASPGVEAELVAVTAEDINICSTNTARLQSAHEWAQRLIDAGLGE